MISIKVYQYEKFASYYLVVAGYQVGPPMFSKPEAEAARQKMLDWIKEKVPCT